MLTQMLWRAAQATPVKPAIVQGNRRIRYEQLYRLAGGGSEGLRRLGIGISDCVAVVLPNCPEFIISLFACARLGAVMLPLNPQYTKDELQRFLSDGQAKVIITDPLRAAVCQQLIAERDRPMPLIVIGDTADDAVRFDDLVDHAEPLEPSETLTDRVLYLYTSGSTSAYKRLCCTQENLYYEAHNFVETIGLSADDPILCTVPLYHSYGFGNGLLDAAYAGSTLVLLEPLVEDGRVIDAPFVSRTQRVLELIQQEAIRFFPGVPYQFTALADLPDDAPVDLSGLKWCISTGDVLPRQTYKRFLERFGIAIRSLYGSTEAGSICIDTDPIESVQFGSLGLPLRNVEIQIRDEKDQELPRDTSGAIWIKSPVIPPNGYDNRPDLSAQVFRDGYYDTGDVGKKDARGHLILTGRKQTFVDVGGYKVDISELEEVLQGHPRVREAAALGVDMRHVGQVIKAVIVPHGACSEADILAYCSERLASYKLPRLIEFRVQLPRSPLGKVLKKELQPQDVTAGIAPLSHALQSLSKQTREQQTELIAAHLQEQVAASLRMEANQIPRLASFQSLGFDSIRAAELQSRLIHLTGLSLSITLLWNHPTIDELAEVLVDKMPSGIAPASAPAEIPASATGAPESVRRGTSLDELWNDIDTLSDEDVDAYFQGHAQPASDHLHSQP